MILLILESHLLSGLENLGYMKVVFLIIVFLHGLIHSLGFLKGFQLKEIRELSLPISKTMGLVWLIATLLFIVFGILYLTNNKFAWVIGFLAVVISQFLIIVYWKDAKFGTIPNVFVLSMSFVLYGSFSFQRFTQSETTQLLNTSNYQNTSIIQKNDINGLPKPIKKWLEQSGMIGKPCINVGKVIQNAELKMKPEQEGWMKAKALQYSIIDKPSFIWMVDVEMNSFLYFQGRDKFENGKGEMLIKMNSLISVVDEKGEKIDEGSMQRYLGEMAWFPSLALSPYIVWEEVNDTTAIATMNYNGSKASGTFYFYQEGDFVKYTAMRFMGNEDDAKRHEWILLVDAYKSFEGIKVPSKMTATWKLDDGDWTWLKLEIIDIEYN